MLKLLFLIVILTAYPVFASCPVDIEGGACVAEIQPTKIQDIVPPESMLSSPATPKKFTGVKDNIPAQKEIEATKNLRDFGANNRNYGYNSSCQFGICSDTGTPKNFPSDKNQ